MGFWVGKIPSGREWIYERNVMGVVRLWLYMDVAGCGWLLTGLTRSVVLSFREVSEV